ncbi:DNA lyase Apn2, partial [Tirmania nivea]
RNPFSYKPWVELKTYGAMFDTLEADIVCFQELKIQKRELTDGMVLVPGWDCYFTFPKHKKGYSGVAIYIRQSKISPMKAEEGITGHLAGPSSTTPYISLPTSQQIGGYPTYLTRDEALLLDSEGRSIILDLGAFILIGTYCPANRDSSRDEFRTAFVKALFERCRNLITMGRRVVLVGDLNIARDEIDSAHAKEAMSKAGGVSFKELSECRMMFDRLLEPHQEGVMVDVCREWWPERRGMYTCWEQRIQARPGNYGARIDYVCCSSDMKSWFSAANIQEGLMGSDHCPVYAVLKPIVSIQISSAGESTETHLLDILNPKGMYINSIKQPTCRASKTYQVPKLSGRLMPEFTARRNIKDMFSKQTVSNEAAMVSVKQTVNRLVGESSPSSTTATNSSSVEDFASAKVVTGEASDRDEVNSQNRAKRNVSSIGAAWGTEKRRKASVAVPKNITGHKQGRLLGFFKPRDDGSKEEQKDTANTNSAISSQTEKKEQRVEGVDDKLFYACARTCANEGGDGDDSGGMHDPIEAKEKWNKLFTRKLPPRCDGHGEPAKWLVTKKKGVNCGRGFWVCARPVGPEGEQKEWRCNFFMWGSDWGNSSA